MSIKIGKLEINLSIQWNVDHPDSWSKFRVRKMVGKILRESFDDKYPIVNHKLGYIKTLRKLTDEYSNANDETKSRWGLLEQKRWVERNMLNVRMSE